MENFIVIAIVVLIVVLAGAYIYKAKKKGNKCIGCPNSACCGIKNVGSNNNRCNGCN